MQCDVRRLGIASGATSTQTQDIREARASRKLFSHLARVDSVGRCWDGGCPDGEGGAILHERGGGSLSTVQAAQRYDPEEWLVTATRSLKRYVEDAFHRSVRDVNGNYCGESVYEVRMVWPGTEIDFDKVPLQQDHHPF